MHNLATPVARGTAALDPSVILQTIEQAGQRRSLDSHSLGDFLLGEFVSAERKMNQGAPFALAQPQGSKTLIESCPPRSGGAEKHESQFIDVWRRHEAEN